MDQYCPVLQITGYKNSGKTTLMTKLIAMSRERGWKTASIKHHGHGGRPTEEAEEKDSRRHLDAGAQATAVEGEGTVYIQINQAGWTLEDTIQMYRVLSPDIIFVEGYKQENYPKVVLLRGQRDTAILQSITNILCVIAWEPLEEKETFSFPVYTLKEENNYLQYIWKKVEGYHDQ